MNYNLSTVRKDPHNDLLSSKYSIIGDPKKLGSGGGSMLMVPSSLQTNSGSASAGVSPVKLKKAL